MNPSHPDNEEIGAMLRSATSAFAPPDGTKEAVRAGLIHQLGRYRAAKGAPQHSWASPRTVSFATAAACLAAVTIAFVVAHRAQNDTVQSLPRQPAKTPVVTTAPPATGERSAPTNEATTDSGLERHLRSRSLNEIVAKAGVIAVATPLDSAPAQLRTPNDLAEIAIQFRVIRLLKGDLSDEVVTIQKPAVGAGLEGLAGKEWIVLLSPEHVAGYHPYGGLLNIKSEPEVEAILSGEEEGDIPVPVPTDNGPFERLAFRPLTTDLAESAEPTSFKASMLVGAPPGVGEVFLDRSLDGRRCKRPISEDGWVSIGKGLRWRSSDRKILGFSEEGPRIYVTIEVAPTEVNEEWKRRFGVFGKGEPAPPMPRTPRQLAGIWLRTPDDLDALREALENQPGPLTLWSSYQPPAAFLPHMEKITAFQQVEPTALIDLSPLDMLTGLTALYLKDCRQMLDLKPLAKLTRLDSVNLSGCTSLRDVSDLGYLKNATYLNLSSCTSLPSVSGVDAMEQLVTLDLADCINLSTLRPLRRLTNLAKLDLSNALRWHPCDLAPLAKLSSLRHLDLGFCNQVRDIAPLAGLTDLVFLDLLGCEATDFSALATLTNLEHLDLGSCSGLSELSPLRRLKNLKRLNLSSCDKVSELSPLSAVAGLIELNLAYCRGVSDLSPLLSLENVRYLSLYGCKQVSDLSSVGHMTGLEKLNLGGCERVSDISPLEELPNLKYYVSLVSCPLITDISPLERHIRRGVQVNADARLQPQLEKLRSAAASE